jgi:hypothetical protein
MATQPQTSAELSEKQHAQGSIFQRFPASIGTATLRSGAVCAVPYHNYDGDALIIWGSADPDFVRSRIKGPWVPLLGGDGRAQVGVWALDYKDTVLNPYKEMVVVFTVTHEDAAAQQVTAPLQQLPLFDDKVAYPYVYKLWLDEQLPVDYGRELIGCDKYLDPAMKIEFTQGQVSLEFHHVDGELNGPAAGPLLSANIRLRDQMQLGGLVDAYGLFRTLSMAAGATNSWHVVTPPGIIDRPDSAQFNPVWEFLYETNPRFTKVGPEDDIKLAGEALEMDFKPLLYQHDPHFRAVLLPPWTFTPVST